VRTVAGKASASFIKYANAKLRSAWRNSDKYVALSNPMA
jgi:hypothetical protein